MADGVLDPTILTNFFSAVSLGILFYPYYNLAIRNY